MRCDVCDGEGRYPIHNNSGGYVYSIKCPECWGFGEIDELTVDLYPPQSTAATINSAEEMREHINKHWRG